MWKFGENSQGLLFAVSQMIVCFRSCKKVKVKILKQKSIITKFYDVFTVYNLIITLV